MANTLPPQNGTLPLPKISFSLPENVDPRDCEKYPNSPYCGGNLIQKTPLGLQVFFSQDSCNFTLNVSPIIAAIATPPIQLTIRSATPECNLPPPPPPVVNEQPPYVPPPQGNSGIYIAVSSGSVSQSITYIQTPEQNISTSVSWDVSFLDLRYPLHINQTIGVPFEGYIDVSDSGNVACYFKNNALNPLYTFQEQAEFQWYPAYVKPSPSVANIVQGLQDLPQIVFFINGYENALLFAQQYKNLDNKNIYPYVSGNRGDLYYGIYQSSTKQTWTIFEYFGNNKPWYPPPPPPKYPKECCMCDCSNSNNDQLLKLILKNIGTLPANVPSTVLTVNGQQPNSKTTVNSLTDLFAYTLTALDSILGEWEVPITLQNTDFSNDKTTNEKVVRLPNLAEAVAEMYSLQWQTHTINEILLNMLTRSMVETGNVKQIAFKNHAAIHAMVDWMNFNHDDKIERMDLLFSVNQKSMESTLTPSQQSVDVIRYTDKHNLMETLHTLLQAAAITRAVHYRVLPDDDDSAAATLKKDLVNLIGNNTDLQTTLQNVINTVQSNYQAP